MQAGCGDAGDSVGALQGLRGGGGRGELPFCPTALFPRASLSSLSFPPLTQLQAKESLTPPRNDKNLPLTCLKVPASYQQGLHCSSRPWTLVAVPLSAGSAARILSPLACLLCLWIFLILGGMGLLAFLDLVKEISCVHDKAKGAENLLKSQKLPTGTV